MNRRYAAFVMGIMLGMANLYAQVDREFWFAAPHIGPNHAGNQTVMLCISAMDVDAYVTIDQPANPSFAKIVNQLVPANTSYIFTINAAAANPYFTMNGTPAYVTNNFLNFNVSNIEFQKVLNYGIHITSTADITVYYDIAGGWNMDLYSLKGKNALGNEFYCPFQTRWPWKRASDIQASSQIDIVSADDNNEIYIVVTAKTSLKANCNVTNALFPTVSPIVNYPGDTIKITLNKGQTYAIRNWDKTWPGALGGTHIWTKDKNKKIAVTITDDSAQTSCGGCADIIGDQLIPVDICGTKYIVMKSMLSAACEGWFFVTIMYDNTTIKINDGTTVTTYGPYNRSIIPTQAVREFQIPAGKNFVYVETSQPVCILHVAGFGCEVGGAILPPVTNCTGSTEVSFYRLNRPNDQFFINLMTRHGAQGGFRLITPCGDTIPIPASWFEYVPGSGDTLSATSPNRGWWVIKDAYKRFGCTGGSCASLKPGCTTDGDLAGGVKNGIPVKVNAVTKIINVIDFFHMGIYGGGTTTTNQYGYFSSFNSNYGKAETVETGSEFTRLCYKDTLTLHASGGLAYEWWYDPNGLDDGDTVKKYLAPGQDKKSVCKAYGFTIPPGDSIGIFNFRVKIKRSVCFGDTFPLVKVMMLAPIFPNITFSKTQLCSDDSVTITNNTTGADPTRYIWQYKDNYKQTSFVDMNVNPVWKKTFKYSFKIPYDSTRLKTVTIRFYAVKEHCEEEVMQDLLVYPSVKAGMTHTPVLGCNPLTVNFTDASRGVTLNQRIWTFGDGGSAFDKNPVHTYYNPLVTKDTLYTGKLTVRNNYCQSDTTFTVRVFRQVRANFSVDTPFYCSPVAPDTTYKLVKVVVNNKAVGGTVSWKFRLGQKEIGTSACSQQRCEFMFPVNLSAEPRVYTITQYVTYNNGMGAPCVDSLSKTVTVYPAITARFTISDSVGCSPKTIQFNKPANKVPLNFLWDFGDGSSSIDTSAIVTHVYRNLTNSDKTYPARLIVQSSFLCRDTFKRNITIAEEVHAYFSVDTARGCAPLRITVTNGSTEYRNACEWYILSPAVQPDTLTAANAVFRRTFDNTSTVPAVINYRLIVRNDNSTAPFFGCPDTMTLPIIIYPKVEAKFITSIDPATTVCQPYAIKFTNNTPLSIADKFRWEFGNGSSSSASDTVTCIYSNLTAKDTTYVASLVAYTPYGCTDTMRKNITVGAYIKAKFALDVSEGCSPLTVKIINQSSQYAAISKYSWDMGNGIKYTKNDTLPITYVYTNKGNVDSVRSLKLVVEHTVAGKTCKDSMISPVTVFPEVHPRFTVSASSGCTPLKVNFVNNTNPAGVVFNWDFGDGTGSVDRDVSHTFVNSNFNDITRTVKLRAESVHKCWRDTSMNITVFGAFNVDFNITRNNVCAGVPVRMVMNVSGTQIASYSWDMDNDGEVDVVYSASMQPDPFDYVYPKADVIKNYAVTVYATSTHGCKDTAVKTAVVYPRVKADFVIQKRNGVSWVDDDSECSPFDSRMKNNSIGASSYEWLFWDGTGSILANPEKIFVNPYYYDITRPITLIATSAYNCKDTLTKNMIVYHKPMAKVEVSPFAGCSPLQVVFQNNSLTSKATYYWDFRDGTSPEVVPDKRNITHSFTTSYTGSGDDQLYPVRLTVLTDTGFCVDTTIANIFVHPRVVAGFEVDTAGCAPFYARFKNKSSSTAVSFMWDFGDRGITSVAENPVYLYADDGTYTATLTARSVNGCADKVSRQITVYSQPTADFITEPMMQIYPSATISLVNRSKGNGSFTYAWDMGDGNRYVKTNKDTFTHTYAWWGDKNKNYKYNVQLIVSNARCADTLVQDVEIRPAVPVARFDTVMSACPPVTIQLTNRSMYAERYEWNFGDGSISTEENPSHRYDTSGLYTITLYAYGEGGTGSMYRNLRLFDVPVADFVLEPLNPMLPEAIIKCSNKSKYAEKYFWNFGDDDMWVEDLNPKHQYHRLGSYWVTLRVVSDSGCKDTMRYPLPVVVEGPGKIVFPNAFTPNPNGPNGGRYNPADQTNDVFFPYHDGVVEYHLEIYNRWGELLFTSDDVYVGWDGYYKGQLCKQDVYVYKATGTFLNGKKFNLSGDVTLLIKQ